MFCLKHITINLDQDPPLVCYYIGEIEANQQYLDFPNQGYLPSAQIGFIVFVACDLPLRFRLHYDHPRLCTDVQIPLFQLYVFLQLNTFS